MTKIKEAIKILNEKAGIKPEPKTEIEKDIFNLAKKRLNPLKEDSEIKQLSEKGNVSQSVIRKQLDYYKKEQNNLKQELKAEIPKYTQEQINNALENFKSKELLDKIHIELNKGHIGDDNLKLTTCLTGTSGLLKNPRLRMSIATGGDSASGKDNNFFNILKHMPTESFIAVTSATQSTIEDDIKDKRIIFFSELNMNRDDGANKYLVEVIKQKAEGGTSAIKKDIREGMKEARHEVGEQATIFYGTTEVEMDDEMGTRFIKTNIDLDPVRIRKVNENTFDVFSDLDKLLKNSKEQDSWIRVGLTHFFNKERQPQIYIPYAKFLKEQIKEQDIFDCNNPRSQRDIKRVLALTSAMTYLFQEQREVVEHNGELVLVSEPQDLINVLLISGDFFNQSYTGLDKRLTDVLNVIKNLSADLVWVARDDIEKEVGKSKNTIKNWCSTLAGEGYLKGIKGKELNQEENTNIYDGNKIYYKRCQKGSKKPLIRCQVFELKQFLEEKTQKQIDTFLFIHNSEDKKGIKTKVSILSQDVDVCVHAPKNDKKMPETHTKTEIPAEIDTFLLTPLKNKEQQDTSDTSKQDDFSEELNWEKEQ